MQALGAWLPWVKTWGVRSSEAITNDEGGGGNTKEISMKNIRVKVPNNLKLQTNKQSKKAQIILLPRQWQTREGGGQGSYIY